MGLFWDLVQQSQISEQRDEHESLDERVRHLERDIGELKRIQLRLLETLESHFGRDLNDDGQIGSR
jgi:hypothetical protein